MDGAGQANASLNVGPAPGTAGISLYFAYALAFPFDFVSYPVKIDRVP